MRRFKLKELLIITISVALMFVMGYFLIPIMSIMPLPAYRALVVAPIYAVGVTLALNYTRKPGTITSIGILIGIILSSFSIIMLIISVMSGIITDVICMAFKDRYKRDRNIFVAAGLFPALQIPLVFYIMAYTVGGAFGDVIKKPIIIVVPTLITFFLSSFVAARFFAVWTKRRQAIEKN